MLNGWFMQRRSHIESVHSEQKLMAMFYVTYVRVALYVSMEILMLPQMCSPTYRRRINVITDVLPYVL